MKIGNQMDDHLQVSGGILAVFCKPRKGETANGSVAGPYSLGQGEPTGVIKEVGRDHNISIAHRRVGLRHGMDTKGKPTWPVRGQGMILETSATGNVHVTSACNVGSNA